MGAMSYVELRTQDPSPAIRYIGMATMAVIKPKARWSVSLATLLVGLVVGALFSYYGISKDGTDTHIVTPAPEFDSPRVTDLPMKQAVATLVADGYRVVAVGRGRVTLQEQGFRGHVLRLVGEGGSDLRYCSARFASCVPVDTSSR